MFFSLDLGASLDNFFSYVITSGDPRLFLVSILAWKKLGIKDLDEGILKILENEKQISLVNTYLGNPGKEFESLIEYSAKQSYPELMKVIIAIQPEGFDIDQCLELRGLHKTPLMHAASNCSGYDDGYFTARYLLDEGANPNIQNKNGCTALHFAAYAGNVRVIQLLKGRGGDCSIPDNFGKTPQMLAEERGYGSEIIALLND